MRAHSAVAAAAEDERDAGFGRYFAADLCRRGKCRTADSGLERRAGAPCEDVIGVAPRGEGTYIHPAPTCSTTLDAWAEVAVGSAEAAAPAKRPAAGIYGAAPVRLTNLDA